MKYDLSHCKEQEKGFVRESNKADSFGEKKKIDHVKFLVEMSCSFSINLLHEKKKPFFWIE